MKPFEHNGKKVEFSAATGEVSGAHKHAETHVSSSGGGGYISQGSGFVSSPKITSTVVVKQEFFLKVDGGKPMPVQLSHWDVPLMDGQKVTMIRASRGKGECWSHFVNHDTRQIVQIAAVKVWSIEWGLVRKPWVSLLVGLALWIAVGYLLNGVIGFLLAVGFWIFEWMNLSKASKALNAHLCDLGTEALGGNAQG